MLPARLPKAWRARDLDVFSKKIPTFYHSCLPRAAASGTWSPGAETGAAPAATAQPCSASHAAMGVAAAAAAAAAGGASSGAATASNSNQRLLQLPRLPRRLSEQRSGYEPEVPRRRPHRVRQSEQHVPRLPQRLIPGPRKTTSNLGVSACDG